MNMKKQYIAPQVENVKMDAIMVDYLGIASVSNVEQQVAD